jgi:hypothetical protein
VRLALVLLFLALALPVSAQLIAVQPRGPAPIQAQAEALAGRDMLVRDIAILQVLDKVSARTTNLRVPVGSSAAFGLMFVTVRSCQVAPPSEPPEAATFVEISEVNLGRSAPANGQPTVTQTQPEKLLFSGWMFASSPALSALEHPTYDVSVIGCEARSASVAERAAGGEEASAVAAPVLAGTPSQAPAAPIAESEPAPQD